MTHYYIACTYTTAAIPHIRPIIRPYHPRGTGSQPNTLSGERPRNAIPHSIRESTPSAPHVLTHINHKSQKITPPANVNVNRICKEKLWTVINKALPYAKESNPAAGTVMLCCYRGVAKAINSW